MTHPRFALAAAIAVSLMAGVACAEKPTLPVEQRTGPTPTLPAPQKSLLPTLKTPKAGAWAEGAAPAAPPGFVVNRFAERLNHPRWVYVLPNGDVLAALSSTEPKPAKSLMEFVQNLVQKRVGAQQPSPDQIVLLRDADGDGVAELQSVMIAGVKQPFGMALMSGQLYVGATDMLVRYPYKDGDRALTMPPEKVIDLPHGPGHWTRNVLPTQDGGKLYVTVGSASNIADKGMDLETGRAVILEVDPASHESRVFASGLRNANGMAIEPTTGALWTVVNERDLLGDDLVPDYLTHVQDGGFYGWPYYYWGDHRDERVPIPANARLRPGIVPDYALGAHVAALGLAFYTAEAFPEAWRGGAFIGEHGSWNRSSYSGYKVVYVPFAEGKPAGPPRDFLTGFFASSGRISGRPVGVAVAKDGALLVADDVGGIIWRVTPKPAT
jgi:glucose/arabinose dehydrogenase